MKLRYWKLDPIAIDRSINHTPDRFPTEHEIDCSNVACKMIPLFLLVARKSRKAP